MKFTQRVLGGLAKATNTWGGFSVNARTGKEPVNRFLVGTSADEASHPMPETPAHLSSYITEHASSMAKPNRTLGGWEHEGQAYEDVPRSYPHTGTGETAARVASIRENQKAYGVTGTEEEGYIGDINNPFHPEWKGDITPGNPMADAHVWAAMPKVAGKATGPDYLRHLKELGLQ